MNTCEDFRILISASLDDELTIEERLILESHLVTCGECQRVEASYVQVNRLVRHDLAESERILTPKERRQSNARRETMAQMRWVGLAAAVSLLLFSLAAVLMRSPTASASQMMAPLAEAHRISQHQRVAQETVLQTLEWELRALRLQLAAAKASPDHRDALDQRLETLLARVDHVQHSYPRTGESQ